MLDRLKWIAAQLHKLADNGNVRYEGQPIFAEARNELADVIATYETPAAPLPPIINQVFGPGELEKLASGIATSLHEKVRNDLEQSDVAVMAALAETRSELLAAVVLPVEPAAA